MEDLKQGLWKLKISFGSTIHDTGLIFMYISLNAGMQVVLVDGLCSKEAEKTFHLCWGEGAVSISLSCDKYTGLFVNCRLY